MASFKVNKDLSKFPLIWGLKLPLFGGFLGVVAIVATTLIAGISFQKILVSIIIIVIAYLVCMALSRFNVFRILFSDQFPDSVKNNINQ